jgi:hypothetical protein
LPLITKKQQSATDFRLYNYAKKQLQKKNEGPLIFFAETIYNFSHIKSQAKNSTKKHRKAISNSLD